MESHVQKWGNSLGIRIPSQMAKELHLHPGSPICLAVEEGRLVIQTPKYDLDSMLDEITHKNIHHLLMEDDQRGGEEW